MKHIDSEYLREHKDQIRAQIQRLKKVKVGVFENNVVVEIWESCEFGKMDLKSHGKIRTVPPLAKNDKIL